ncbi:MAG: nitronate monooxygenase [Candidatus Omnitrophica bacterium]|nr:nitronate monooxygenase [Candidatus Omnitrophota bacterium]
MINKLNPLIIGDLEIKIPIIQGGMGVKVSTASLAGAVADYGAAGTIASAALGIGTPENEIDFVKSSREGLEREIRQARKITQGVIGVNILVAVTNYEDLVKTAVKEKADYIISGAGLPLKLPEFTKGSPVKLIPIVSSAKAADLIIRTWQRRYDRLPDAIVVEGPLAGGHLGFKPEELVSSNGNSLEHLVGDVLSIVKKYETGSNPSIPVIAAGGIFDGKDVARFLCLGARGVQIATRFVTTHECSVADEFKNKYIAAREEDIVIIDSPVGMPGRAIRTKFIDRMMNGPRMPIRCGYQCLKPCNPKTVSYCINDALFNAVTGDIDNAVVFAGSNVARITKIVSVKELLDEIVSETLEELNKKG